MPYLSAKQAEALSKLLGKLREKSSVAGYLIALLGSVGVTDTGWVPQVAGWVAIGASVLLFLFNDETVHSWLVSDPTPAEAMEPAEVPSIAVPVATIPNPEETTMSKLSAYFAVIKHAADAVFTAEVSATAGSSGADKLDIAKSALEAAYPELGIADVAFETVWPLVKPFIDSLVAKFKAAKVVETSAPVADTAIATNPSA